MTVKYRKGVRPYEGFKLVGSPTNINSVMNWIESYGLPRLVDPTPEVEPFTGARMLDPRGELFQPGIYIHPTAGVLIIRNRYRQVLKADYGDWVMRDMVNNNFIVVKEPALNALYKPVIEV